MSRRLLHQPMGVVSVTRESRGGVGQQREQVGALGFHGKKVIGVPAAADPIDDLLARYGGEPGALIPLLQKVQERYGYLKGCHIQQIARFLKLSPSEVYGVLTFYAQFRLTPPGRTHVRVCQGTACHVRGGKRILQELESVLNVRAGSTSEDFEYSLEKIACFGACSLAPVVVVGSEVHGRMTPQKVRKLFEGNGRRLTEEKRLEAVQGGGE